MASNKRKNNWFSDRSTKRLDFLLSIWYRKKARSLQKEKDYWSIQIPIGEKGYQSTIWKNLEYSAGMYDVIVKLVSLLLNNNAKAKIFLLC